MKVLIVNQSLKLDQILTYICHTRMVDTNSETFAVICQVQTNSKADMKILKHCTGVIISKVPLKSK